MNNTRLTGETRHYMASLNQVTQLEAPCKASVSYIQKRDNRRRRKDGGDRAPRQRERVAYGVEERRKDLGDGKGEDSPRGERYTKGGKEPSLCPESGGVTRGHGPGQGPRRPKNARCGPPNPEMTGSVDCDWLAVARPEY